MFWVNILNNMAEVTALSYTELKALEVKEFFLIVTNKENVNATTNRRNTVK